jgi:hypothetical protein
LFPQNIENIDNTVGSNATGYLFLAFLHEHLRTAGEGRPVDQIIKDDICIKQENHVFLPAPLPVLFLHQNQEKHLF